MAAVFRAASAAGGTRFSRRRTTRRMPPETTRAGSIVAVAPEKHEGQARCEASHPRQDLEALAADPLQILEDHDHGPWLPPEELLHGEQQAGLCRAEVDGGCLGHLAPEQPSDVRYDG